MSAFWNFVNRFTPGTLAKAEDVNGNFDGVDNAFTLVEAETESAIRVITEAGVTTIAANAAARANKYLQFDAVGDIGVSVTILGDWRGDHAAAGGTDYVLNDVVKDATGALGQDNIYVCTNAHTSTGTLADDVAEWDLLVDAAASKTWAIKVDGVVADSEYSSKAYAIGGTGITDTVDKGAAKEWATKAEDSLVDTVEYSAKHYAAKAAASYDSFDDRYLGPKSSPPTLDNDGQALVEGATYFDTGIPSMRVWDGSDWSTISGLSTATVFEYIATASQTVFTGLDENGAPLDYVPGFLLVSVNGSWLSPTEYTATNGTSATLPAQPVGAQVQMLAFGVFDIADAYTKTEAAAKFALKAAVTTSQASAYEVDVSVYALADITMTGNVAITFANEPIAGIVAELTLVLTHSGSARTPSFPASVIWDGGSAPTWTTTVGNEDVVKLVSYDNGTTWRGRLLGQDYA